MRIGKLFHLTPFVDDLGAAEFFFNSVFSPFCMLRNYSSHWHRNAAMYVIGETSIEIMQPLPPPDGQRGTSWFRYMDRFGPRVHNIAFFVDDRQALAERLEAAGVRITDGGSESTVFAHPKDTPGMLEFQETGGVFPSIDPRFSDHWPAFRDDYWPKRHPLGVERMSHITVVVHDVEQARTFYTDVLDAVSLDDQASTVPDADARYVLVGEDTVIELARPRDAGSPAGRDLATVGQHPVAVTFTVRDLEQAAGHLERAQAPVIAVGDHDVVLDRTRTWNTEYRFTDRSLAGDPR